MTEANKKSFKHVGLMLLGIGVWTMIALYVPDGSLVKQLLSILVGIVIVLAIVFTTPLGNPVKKLIRKILGKKEEPK